MKKRGDRLDDHGPTQCPAREAWVIICDLAVRLRAHWMSVAAEAELTPSQAMALKHLDPAAPVSMANLAEQLACDASNVTGIVDKLELRGLIARQPAGHDRRVKMLAVTAKGAALRARFLDRLLTPPRALQDLSADEQVRVRDTLGQLLQRWPRSDTDG